MEKIIWKYDCAVNDVVTIEMPVGAEILTVQSQHGNPRIWALVDPNNSTEKRYFEMFGTGHPINCDGGITKKYIGSFQLYDGDLIFHLFETI